MIAIIDYGVGNPASILNMLKKIGTQAILTRDKAKIRAADKLILPGVGAFDHGMVSLEKADLIGCIEEEVLKREKPILGICLGMQMLGTKSEEGEKPGLGWINFETVKFCFLDAEVKNLKVPHMGWNNIDLLQPDNVIFYNWTEQARFYFVHSYHAICEDTDNVLATTHYGYRFACVVGKNNILGVQFHPEKSHRYGMQLLKNFAERFVKC